jgi:hypothetical protein
MGFNGIAEHFAQFVQQLPPALRQPRAIRYFREESDSRHHSLAIGHN